MAFPWAAICKADLAGGHLVEDMRLGLDLAAAGYPAIFCPQAVVTSQFPTSASGSATQRQRWEHGHIHMILTLAPRFLRIALARRNLNLAILALDLAIPPLAVLTLILCGTLFLAGSAALSIGRNWGSTVAVVDLVAFFSAVMLAWLRWGREVLPAASALSIASYVLSKLGLYRDVLMRRAAATWVRTARSE
jgi:cellulose synthase/poly-beta-1,6-N-acetylglucosamine synthase-like glycosyltransferase